MLTGMTAEATIPAGTPSLAHDVTSDTGPGRRRSAVLRRSAMPASSQFPPSAGIADMDLFWGVSFIGIDLSDTLDLGAAWSIRC